MAGDIAEDGLRRRRTLGVTMGALVACVALGVGISTAGHETQAVRATPTSLAGKDGFPHVTAPTERCPGAVDVAVGPSDVLGSRLESATGTKVFLPGDQRATAAWACGTEPVAVFGHVEINFEDGWAAVDADEKLRSLLDGSDQIQQIGGRPAYVHVADDRGPNNAVVMIVGDTMIRLRAAADTPIAAVTGLAHALVLPEK